MRLYLRTAEKRRALGHRVVLLDPFHIIPGARRDGFNLLDICYLRREDMFAECQTLANNLSEGGSTDERYWDDNARNLISGGLLGLLTHQSKAKREARDRTGPAAHPVRRRSGVHHRHATRPGPECTRTRAAGVQLLFRRALRPYASLHRQHRAGLPAVDLQVARYPGIAGEEHLRPAGHHRRKPITVHRHAARQDGQSPCADGPMAARPVHRHHDAQETAEGAHPVPARRNGHTRKVPDVVHLHRHLSLTASGCACGPLAGAGAVAHLLPAQARTIIGNCGVIQLFGTRLYSPPGTPHQLTGIPMHDPELSERPAEHHPGRCRVPAHSASSTSCSTIRWRRRGSRRQP